MARWHPKSVIVSLGVSIPMRFDKWALNVCHDLTVAPCWRHGFGTKKFKKHNRNTWELCKDITNIFKQWSNEVNTTIICKQQCKNMCMSTMWRDGSLIRTWMSLSFGYSTPEPNTTYSKEGRTTSRWPSHIPRLIWFNILELWSWQVQCQLECSWW